MSTIEQRAKTVIARVQQAAGTRAEPPTLIAVSKTRSAEEIRAAWSAGIRDFGENYLTEALPKIEALADLPITWHFIGAVQGNKTRPIGERFDWVHSVDRVRIAERLDRARSGANVPLRVCVQVNIDREANKAGVLPEALPELLGAVSACRALDLRGLMAIPRPRHSSAEQRAVFAALRTLRDVAEQTLGVPLPVLSMGMSADFEAALAEGATHVRIGTAIFGPRLAPGKAAP